MSVLTVNRCKITLPGSCTGVMAIGPERISESCGVSSAVDAVGRDLR
jgi:hypothetical protein